MGYIGFFYLIKSKDGSGSYYRPQTWFAKVMFLHLSVILLTGGVCVVAHGGGGGMRGCSRGGGACVGYDEIRRYGQ